MPQIPSESHKKALWREEEGEARRGRGFWRVARYIHQRADSGGDSLLRLFRCYGSERRRPVMVFSLYFAKAATKVVSRMHQKFK